MASVPSSSSLPVSHVRRHEDVSTPSAPPTKRSNNQSQPPESYEPNTWLQQQREQEQQKKLAAENIKKQSIEATGNNEMVGEEEEVREKDFRFRKLTKVNPRVLLICGES